MGEAKRRFDAYAAGRPWQPALICPRCRSARCAVSQRPAWLLSHVETAYGICLDCKTFWEAYPADWQEEPVGAPSCDNCAFAKGSPESGDREGWLSLLAKLRLGQEFRCHKGAPIVVDEKAGTAQFDADWVNRHGRTCAGFLKAMQQWPDWLEHRYSVLHVSTKFDQDRALGLSLDDAADD